MTSNLETSRILARALSRPAFTAIARGEAPERVFKFLYDAEVVKPGSSLASLFEIAYTTLHKNYRNEYIYKTAIANKVVFGRHSPRTAALSVELPVGKSIVDVAIFNGTSTAYEIKTAFDSPRRLATQTPDYLKAFDKVNVVAHPDFAQAYADQVDDRVGILTIDTKDRIRVVRPALSNLENLSSEAIFKILRRDEYVSALERLLKIRINLPNGLVHGFCEQLFSSVSREDAHRVFVSAMRNRTINKEAIDFISALPRHLRVLGYSAPLSRPQRKRILETLSLA